MPRKGFRETFEVKNEMSDGEKIRPDDYKYRNNGGNSSLEQRLETLEEASKVGGFDDTEMDMKSIKNKVLNFADCSIEEIDEILNFIADRKREELGIDLEFQTVYDDGGRVKPERTQEGLQDVEIGEWPLASIKKVNICFSLKISYNLILRWSRKLMANPTNKLLNCNFKSINNFL